MARVGLKFGHGVPLRCRALIQVGGIIILQAARAYVLMFLLLSLLKMASSQSDD
jgi:hypothetical protein